MKLVKLNDKPLIFTLEGLLSEKEINHVLELSKDKLKRSQTGDPDNSVISEYRTSDSCFVETKEDEIAELLKDKISLLLNIHKSWFDTWFQIVHYDKNKEYKAHTDPILSINKEHSMYHRRYTCLFYLNDVEEGGETVFPKLGLMNKPKKGKLLFFENYKKDGDKLVVHPFSEHSALPVIKGEKWAFTQWIHSPIECDLDYNVLGDFGGSVEF